MAIFFNGAKSKPQLNFSQNDKNGDKSLYFSGDNILIRDNKLENTDQIKFLGITIDKRITFRIHIEYTINKCIPAIALINKLKKSYTKYQVPKKKVIILYKTLILSKVEYGHCLILTLPKSKINESKTKCYALFWAGPRIIGYITYNRNPM